MNFAAARHNMVENQLRTNRVTDRRLIAALEAIPREIFVPESKRDVAYFDGEIAIGGGRQLLAPMVFARMIQEAGIASSDVVLDIGCGSGYSAAVLSKLGSTVVALESDAALAANAQARFAELALDNVALVSGRLIEGHAGHGPYNVIILEGAVPKIPEALTAQLAEGGRLIAVVARGSAGQAVLARKLHGAVSSRSLFDARAGSLPEFQPQPGFVF